MTPARSTFKVLLCRTAFYLLLCSVFLLPAFSHASGLQEPRVLKTIIIDNYAPYTYVNKEGQPAGFTVDLMQAVAQVMGFEIEIKVDTWDHALHALESGDIDFLPMMAYSKERDKTFDFSPPHTIAYDAFFTRQDSGVVNSLADLAGRTIIVMENDQAHQYLKSVSFIQQDQLILVNSLPQALQLLASGKGDTALMPKLVGLLLIHDLNLTDLAPSPVVVEAYNRPFSFAVKNGNQAVLERLNQGMIIIKTEGKYDEIYKNWFGALEPGGLYNDVFLKYLGYVILGLALIGALLLIWTFLLRKQVAVRTRSLTMEMQERKQAEEALRESNDYLENLFNYANAPIIVWDTHFKITRFNHAFKEITGRSESEVLGKPLEILFPPDQTDLSMGLIHKTLTGERWEVVEIAIQHVDGSIRMLLWNSATLFSADGKTPVATIAQGQDITARKQAEEEMENMARFPAENPSPVLRVNRDGNLLYINEAGLALLHDWHLVVGEPVPQVLHQAVTESMAGHLKEWIDTVQGGRILSFSVSPIREAGYANFYGRDVTRSRQAEAERERLLDELERKNQELESIVYVASHDLRSPLVNIQGFGVNLQKYFRLISESLKNARSLDELRVAAEPILTERIPKALQFVEVSSMKMDVLISGLLRLSRIGRIWLQLEVVDMDLLVQNILDGMAFQIEKASAEFRVQLPLTPCYGDKDQLSQVFSNLLDNAIKYRAFGRPLAITISSEINDRKVVYSITDTGQGIAPEHQEKIWEIFHRFEEDATIPGEGLGLTIARRIIERHRGRIWVESKPEVGSCFRVELPLGA